MADDQTESPQHENVIDLTKLPTPPNETIVTADCDTRCKLGDGIHAAHVFILAKTEKRLFNQIPMNGFVLMLMRHDGCLGFPGGLIDAGETVTEGLNRELREEIGLKTDLCIDDGFYFSSHGNYRNVHLHFYTKLVSEGELDEIERGALSAHEHGHEVLGLVRVPLYIYDGNRGLPAFLSHKFIGNAREQLLLGLQKYKVIKIDETKATVTVL